MALWEICGGSAPPVGGIQQGSSASKLNTIQRFTDLLTEYEFPPSPEISGIVL